MDAFNLNRFIEAQENTFPVALAELRNGRKTSHWIWYIFPQLRGLGRSTFSDYYGISGIAEAAAYLNHPVLGQRLIDAIQAIMLHGNKEITEILGYTDAKKFRSCLTLFNAAAPDCCIFRDALEMFYHGREDYRTLQLLQERKAGQLHEHR